MQEKYGFTLIETLIGLTIIAVLTVGAYTVWQQVKVTTDRVQPNTTPKSAPSGENKSSFADWQNYTVPFSSERPSSDYPYEAQDVSFSYPKSWHPTSDYFAGVSFFSFEEPSNGYDLSTVPKGEVRVDVLVFSRTAGTPLVEEAKQILQQQAIAEPGEIFSDEPMIIGGVLKAVPFRLYPQEKSIGQETNAIFLESKNKTTGVMILAYLGSPSGPPIGNSITLQIAQTVEFVPRASL